MAESAWAAKIAVFRTTLLALPSKVAARVKMASTVSDVAKLIREEINGALAELARGSAATDGEAA